MDLFLLKRKWKLKVHHYCSLPRLCVAPKKCRQISVEARKITAAGLIKPAGRDSFFSKKAVSNVYIMKSFSTHSTECVLTGTRTLSIIFMGLIFR